MNTSAIFSQSQVSDAIGILVLAAAVAFAARHAYALYREGFLWHLALLFMRSRLNPSRTLRRNSSLAFVDVYSKETHLTFR